MKDCGLLIRFLSLMLSVPPPPTGGINHPSFAVTGKDATPRVCGRPARDGIGADGANAAEMMCYSNKTFKGVMVKESSSVPPWNAPRSQALVHV